MLTRKHLSWLLIIYVVFVFVQSLYFKFTGSEETTIIFNTIGDWLNGTIFSFAAPAFKSIGGYAVGIVELIASILLLFSRSRIIGAFIGLMVISGAIFFHLFTPLGVDRVIDAAGNTDGGVLFYMACGVWVSCAALLFIECKNKKNTI